MMRPLIILLGFLVGLSGSAQDDPCQDLNIDLTIDPLVPGYLLVHVENNSSEIFSYPGWRVFDEMDNLIGEEVVNFFGIAQESIHPIAIDAEFEMDVEYDFYLELWVGFYDSLMCSYSLSAIPFPSVNCGEFTHSMGASSPGELQGETVAWSVSDLDNNLIESGLWDTAENNWFLDSLCLQTGCYKLELEATGILNTNIVSSINSWVWDGSNATILSADNPSGELIFGIYSPDCLVDYISESQVNSENWNLFPNPIFSELTINTEVKEIQTYEILNAQGKLLKSGAFQNSETLILQDIPSGMYVLRVNGRESKKFLKVD